MSPTSMHSTRDEDGWARALDAVTAWLDAGGDVSQLDRLFAGLDPTLHPHASRLLETVAALAALDQPTEPADDLRDRLLARVRSEAESASADAAQVWRHWPGPNPGGDVIRGAAVGPFEPTPIPGIEVRRLYIDRAADRVAMLVRMAPGTTYPRHRHGGVEECYVLSGDLCHRDRVMHAGDFEVVTEGSIHDVQSTKGGCLLLIHSSLHDEILAA